MKSFHQSKRVTAAVIDGILINENKKQINFVVKKIFSI